MRKNNNLDDKLKEQIFNKNDTWNEKKRVGVINWHKNKVFGEYGKRSKQRRKVATSSGMFKFLLFRGTFYEYTFLQLNTTFTLPAFTPYLLHC